MAQSLVTLRKSIIKTKEIQKKKACVHTYRFVLDTSNDTDRETLHKTERSVHHPRQDQRSELLVESENRRALLQFYLQCFVGFFPGMYLIGFFGAGYSIRTPSENTIGLHQSGTL